MILYFMASIVISILTGFILVNIFLPRCKSFHHFLLKGGLAAGAGIGLSSYVYFICLALCGPSLLFQVIAETGLIFAIGGIGFNKLNPVHVSSQSLSISTPSCNAWFNRLLSTGFCVAIATSISTFVYRSILVPCGGWDAWAIWNFFARFLYRGGNHWKDGFSALLKEHHPDYPLLLASSVARGWGYAGSESRIVPITIAFCFTFATVLILSSSITILKNRSQGLLAGITLLGTPNFVILGSQQYADVPLGFFFLSTFVLLGIQDVMAESPGISFLAGVMAGLSSWTKNEGFLFVVSLLVVRSVYISSTDRNKVLKPLCFFSLGAAAVLFVVLFFKLTIAPQNDIMSSISFHSVDGLLDLNRFLLLSSSFISTISVTIPLFFLTAILPFVLGVVKADNWIFNSTYRCSFAVLTTMMVGYFIVYLLSPYDLKWHITTSLPRLILQLWPSVIFMTFLKLRTPEEALTNC